MTARWDILDCEPHVLGHVVGHGYAREQLRVAVDSCYADPRRSFPATLIVGPEGSRSLLARVVARELVAPLTEIDGQIVAVAGQVYQWLLDLEAGDCVLLDGLDEVPPKVQAVLFLALKYRRLGGPTSRDKPPRNKPLPSCTVVATATDDHKILTFLRRLFPSVVRLQPLGTMDVARIVEQRARAMRWHLAPGVARAVAAAAGTTPRDALNLLDYCHRRSRSRRSPILEAEDLPGWFQGGGGL